MLHSSLRPVHNRRLATDIQAPSSRLSNPRLPRRQDSVGDFQKLNRPDALVRRTVRPEVACHGRRVSRRDAVNDDRIDLGKSEDELPVVASGKKRTGPSAAQQGDCHAINSELRSREPPLEPEGKKKKFDHEKALDSRRVI